MSPSPGKSVKQRVAELRRGKDKAHIKRTKVTREILGDLKTTGTFFNTTEGFFYFAERPTRTLLPIDASSVGLSAMIDQRYGINEAEATDYKHIVAAMRNEAYSKGDKVQIRRLAYLDEKTWRLYVSRFDGTVYRLDGKCIEEVANGTDNVFFLDDPKWKPYRLVENVGAGLIDKIILDPINFVPTELGSDDQRRLFRAWMLAQFFDALHPTRPIVLMCGEKGSGKTSALRRLIQMIFGNDTDVVALDRSKPDGFIAVVTNDPLSAFDNVDEKIPWLQDHLARVATGTDFPMRQLYTTNERVRYKARSWVAVTSRTPKFIDGRDDLLDRTLILNVARLASFEPEHTILKRVSDHRNKLMTELLHELNRVVAYCKTHGASVGNVSHRMADFAQTVILLGRVNGEEKQMKRVLEQLEKRQHEALMSEEPIVHCLEIWLREGPAKAKGFVDSATLNSNLSAIACAGGIDWPYKNAFSLAQRLSHIGSALRQKFEVEEVKDSSNQKRYRFGLKPPATNPGPVDKAA